MTTEHILDDFCDRPEVSLQWLGQASYRLHVKEASGETHMVYLDPNLSNPSLPRPIQRQLKAEVVFDDADLIVLTHCNFQHFVSAIPLLLASIKPSCRIACLPGVAAQLLAT